MLYWDLEVSKLKTWQLYVGFVFIQIVVGIIVTLLVAVFDLAGIRGALSQVVRQLAVVMNAQPPQKWVAPIAGEIKEGKYI
jgi:uncharacterized phage infection (PIP) family protein YhgE